MKEDVLAELEPEVVVLEYPRFDSGLGEKLVVARIKSGPNEMLIVLDEDIPDDDRVFNRAMFLVQKPTVKDGDCAGLVA